jgi:hypothetical protein
MDAERLLIGTSLFLLAGLLVFLAARALRQYVRERVRPQLMWGGGVALAAAAVLIEGVVYFGVVTVPLLQAYVFFSAAIVGVLSLGATRILKRPRVERIYAGWTVATCALVAGLSFATPLSTSMVSNGIISGDPPLALLIVSTLVTGPATVLLLTASYLSLKRHFRWPSVLMAAGAVILGAGGTLYIASFPVALYYAEFLGIFLLFLGIVNLPTASPIRATAPAARSL